MKTGAPVNTGYTGGPQYRTQICEAPKLDKKCILNLGTVTGMKNATSASMETSTSIRTSVQFTV